MNSRWFPVVSISSFRILCNSSLREVDNAGATREGRLPTKTNQTQHYTQPHGIKWKVCSPTFGWFVVGRCQYTISYSLLWLCTPSYFPFQEHVATNSVTTVAALVVSQRAMQDAGLEKSYGSRTKPEQEHHFEKSKIQERNHQCRDSQ